MKVSDAFRDWRAEGNVRRDVIKLALLAGLVALAAVIFLFIGFFNVAASTGHWKITDWVLHTVMRQSVQFHSAGIEPPPLDDMGLAIAGAGHFESGCAPCHGSPAAPRNPVVREMTPQPPDLATAVPSWEANNLFWIVKHGVKFTGMPAWPTRHRTYDHGAEQDMEIWSLVAFLQRLPGMEAEQYERLALGPVAEPAGDDARARLVGLSDPILPLVRNCARCHGYDGRGRGSDMIPRLDLQKPAYLYLSLKAYAAGTRPSGIMELQASGLSDEEMRALANYFGSEEPGPVDAGTSFISEAFVERGRELAMEGAPARAVPACAACHAVATPRPRPHFPNLAGQRRAYVERQLRYWRAEVRGGTTYHHLMEAAARNLEDADIVALSAYFASLEPGGQ